ncbi:GPI mannosyltransferase 2 [Lepeophtheirus salmonis]|uniref:GPI mannosyltransferase 2 n=1 Tax=Lepeophtheirus salmonis TaxID=72036 RepID=UPI001AE720F1|nr:GPI mannosyltransferase 2-like [Lepeophtheirus salmonis]
MENPLKKVFPTYFKTFGLPHFFREYATCWLQQFHLSFFQWFSYTAYCVRSTNNFHADLLKNGKFRKMPPMPNENISSWCMDDTPMSYFYIHSTYGNFGIAQFRDIDELPLLLLSLPAIVLIGSQIYNFFLVNRRYALRFGLIDNALLGIPKLRVPPLVPTQSLPRETFIYLFHSIVLVVATSIIYPAQEVTRHLCSGSPILYWIAALATTPAQTSLVPILNLKDDNREEVANRVEKRLNLRNEHATILLQEKECGDMGNLVKFFFITSFLVGTGLYANDYPWA